MNKLLLQLTIIAQDSIPAEQNPLCQIQQFTERTADYITYTVNGLCGVMHRETGDIILPPRFESIVMVSPTTFKAELDDIDGYVLYDIHGKLVDY